MTGTNASGTSGDAWAADTFSSDQYSEVAVSSTALSGSEWVGPMVRSQDNGQDAYVGAYYWNDGSPVLELLKRTNGSWEQLGSTYNSGALATGTELELAAVGSAITLSEDGAVVVSATDSSLSGGAPGIMAYGTPTAGDWAGGDVIQGVLLWYHHDQTRLHPGPLPLMPGPLPAPPLMTRTGRPAPPQVPPRRLATAARTRSRGRG